MVEGNEVRTRGNCILVVDDLSLRTFSIDRYLPQKVRYHGSWRDSTLVDLSWIAVLLD